MPVAQPCLVVLHAEARGIVDKDVDAAERVGGVVDEARDSRPVGQIAGRAIDGAAMLLELSLGCLHAFGAARADGHIGSVGGKGQRDGSPDAAAATSDDRPLTLE